MDGQITFLEGDPIRLFNGSVEVIPQATVTNRGALSDGASYDLEIIYDSALGRFVASSVTIHRGGEGLEITSRMVREVTIQEIIVEIGLSEMTTLWSIDEDGPTGKQTGAEALSSIQPAAGRSKLSVLEDVQLIHLLAKLGNLPPLVTIAQCLQISHSTAKRLVASPTFQRQGPKAD